MRRTDPIAGQSTRNGVRADGEAEAARHAAAEPNYTAAVYGSLLVTTLIAVQWRHDTSTGLVGLTLLTSVAVFWLAHVWSAIVNERVRAPIGWAEARAIAAAEAPMLLAAIIPAALLGLNVFRMVTVDEATAIALVASIVQLFLWGIAVGRAAHSRWSVALGIATVDCLLGILIVVLKVVIIH